MNLQTLEKLVDESYLELGLATKDYADAAIVLEQKKYTNEIRKAKLMQSGLIDGKNQSIRDAQLQEAMAKDLDELHQLDMAESRRKFKMQQVQIAVDRACALLRIAELTEEK